MSMLSQRETYNTMQWQRPQVNFKIFIQKNIENKPACQMSEGIGVGESKPCPKFMIID